ncbi:hypothetical protein PIB30_090959 [Stylosanthes scabra]|uniref:Uncharacterized protein n=1 Tax=Stylosanthes scabra TaxID=79078 RepID=A0ABU6XU34_9FABA|nr:hypothetical protein [Stylosanthes scabra]
MSHGFVPMELHVGNRQNPLESLRHHLSQSTLPLRDFVLLQCGQEQTRHDTYHLELFRRVISLTCLESENLVSREPLLDVESEESIHFAPRLPDEYAVWLGEIKPLSYFKEHYVVSTAFFMDIDDFNKDLTTLHPILECRVIKSEM